MKYNVMKKWVKALRSGDYKQGRETLCTSDQYCCLGVLCELASKENICDKTENLFDSSNIEYDEHDDVLPQSVRDWSGMKTDSGDRLGKRISLLALNDTNRYSFERIANIIEKEYKDL